MIFLHRFALLICIILPLLFFQGCGGKAPSGPEYPQKKGTQRPYTINGKTYYPIDTADGYREKGDASWYGKQFHGRKTANGETYNMYGMTAAHKILPMNTVLLVRNLDNGREAVVRVNDRGPFARGRIIDLSYAAAKEIDMIGRGLARTEIIAMGQPTSKTKITKGKATELAHQDFSKGNYFVQVGSFLKRDNAERLARSFLDKNFRVVIQPYITSGYTYYRVQIFAGTDLKPARRLEKELLNSFQGAFLISREVPGGK